MTESAIQVGIVHYPGAMLSAVQGLAEQFHLANKISVQNNMGDVFKINFCDSQQLSEEQLHAGPPLHVVILPPCLDDEYYSAPQSLLLQWLQRHHQQGAIICSICAGAFVLAQTGLLDGRQVTTHWALADEFSRRFPSVQVDTDKLLINDADIITAGGLMSWVDLGLELVAQFTNTQIMRQLGKYLIVDTGHREQRYYQSFNPPLNHGDKAILQIQHHLQRHYSEPVMIKELANQAHLTERTFLRRFVSATGFKPAQYLQRLRIHKACELIETSCLTVEGVAIEVGYEDLSAFRKTFIKIMGETPKEFKKRFVRSQTG